MESIYVWYYKSCSTNGVFEWIKYRDIANDLIEEAFQRSEPHVFLDRYRIDFNDLVQIDRYDETQRQPVKREVFIEEANRAREHRFGSYLSSVASSSFGDHDSWCPFLKAWLQTPSGKRVFIDHRKCLEACAQGIIKEGELHDSHSKVEAAYMAGKILQCIGRPTIEATQLCINLYTKDSFLYFALNNALREEDHSKLETLGPYCFLLRNYSRYSQDYIGTVYRGVQLNEEQIETYREAIGKWKTWPAFTSTTKDRNMAASFGTTLFVIEITRSLHSLPRSFDIRHLSNYPWENEVLLPAGIIFQILSVEHRSDTGSIIHVKI